MTYLYAALLCAVNLLWLGMVLLGLPGNWLIVATTAAYAWWRWDGSRAAGQQEIAVVTLCAMGGLALLAEGLELAGGLIGSKQAGGSRWGAFGALIGTVIGAIAGTVIIPIPVVGSILGACGGAAAGACALEYASGRTLMPALKSAAGAGAGRFAGMMVKLGVGGVIWMIASLAAFVP